MCLFSLNSMRKNKNTATGQTGCEEIRMGNSHINWSYVEPLFWVLGESQILLAYGWRFGNSKVTEIENHLFLFSLLYFVRISHT